MAPELKPEEIRALLEPFTFEQALQPLETLDFIVQGLWQQQVHTPHACYFGLFNPAPTTMSIVTDTLHKLSHSIASFSSPKNVVLLQSSFISNERVALVVRVEIEAPGELSRNLSRLTSHCRVLARTSGGVRHMPITDNKRKWLTHYRCRGITKAS